MDFIVRAIYKLTKGRKNHIKKTQQVTTWDRFLFKADKYIGNPHARVESKDTAVILYSGGTTGKPKGVLLTNLNFNALALGAKYLVPDLIRTEYSFLTFLLNFHAFGLGCCIHMPLYFGARVVLIPQFNAKKLKKYITKYKINILVGVPAVFEYLMKIKFKKNELKCVKHAVSGGDMISMSSKERVNDFLKAHPAAVTTFIKEHGDSVVAANSDLDTTAALVVAQEIIGKEPVAKKAIPQCNIVFITGDEMKTTASGFYQVLFNADPQSVAGSIPDDGIYLYVE
jgi:acyl-coenzyme A synthetase/AMP-(fatty) acid ligase